MKIMRNVSLIPRIRKQRSSNTCSCKQAAIYQARLVEIDYRVKRNFVTKLRNDVAIILAEIIDNIIKLLFNSNFFIK